MRRVSKSPLTIVGGTYIRIIPCNEKRGTRKPRSTRALPSTLAISPQSTRGPSLRSETRRSTNKRAKKGRKLGLQSTSESKHAKGKNEVELNEDTSAPVISTSFITSRHCNLRESITSPTVASPNHILPSAPSAYVVPSSTGSMDLDPISFATKPSCIPRNTLPSMSDFYPPQQISSMHTLESGNVMANHLLLPRLGTDFPSQVHYKYSVPSMLTLPSISGGHMPLSYVCERMNYDASSSPELMFTDSDSSHPATNSPYLSPNASIATKLGYQ
jgi:hypothetical protein